MIIQNSNSDIEKRILRYDKENKALLRKYKLEAQPVVAFKKKEKISLLGRFAIWIISKQGGETDIKFTSIVK